MADGNVDVPAAPVAGDEVPVPAVAAEGAVSADDCEVTDPAAEAARCRQAARDARELAARSLAEAEAEVRRITEAAQAEVRRLGDQAADAESDAAYWEGQAALDARIAGLRGELGKLGGAAARLAGEAAGLEGQAAEARERLKRLGERVMEADARRAAAHDEGDADKIVDAIREAIAETAAATEAAQVQQQRLAAAVARLGELDGDKGELALVRAEFARMVLALDAAERERAGLPERKEVLSAALGLMGGVVAHLFATDPARLAGLMLAAVPEEQRPLMEETIRRAPDASPEAIYQVACMAAGPRLLPGIIGHLEQVAGSDPEQYAALRRAAFMEPARAEREPSLRDLLAKPSLTGFSDGTVGWSPAYRGGRAAAGAVAGPAPGDVRPAGWQ